MTENRTEQHHPHAAGLESRADEDILSLLAKGQQEAALAVNSAIPAIADAAERAAGCVRAGGRLVYAAAGSSGLMALADALELPGTYGLARERIVVLLAGGAAALTDMRGGPEDDGAAARQAVLALQPGESDCVIALSASGHTPYAVEALRAARERDSTTIGLSNNAGVSLFEVADVAICLPTPPELIAGSTRMGAGTAQKIALNMFSTLMAIRLGHVHDGMMVNVVADNEKLRTRARGMVARIAGVDDARASAALDASSGAVKLAVLLAAGVPNMSGAEQLLTESDGILRDALSKVGR